MKVLLVCLFYVAVASSAAVGPSMKGWQLLRHNKTACLTANHVTAANVNKTLFYNSKIPISPDMQCYASCVMQGLRMVHKPTQRNATANTKQQNGAGPHPDHHKKNQEMAAEIKKECHKNKPAPGEKPCITAYKAKTCFMEKYHQRTLKNHGKAKTATHPAHNATAAVKAPAGTPAANKPSNATAPAPPK